MLAMLALNATVRFNFAIGIATLPASVLFGFLYDGGGSLIAFGTGVGLSLAASVMLLWTTRTRVQ